MLTENLTHKEELLNRAYLLPLYNTNFTTQELLSLTTFGRATENSIVLDDPFVSNRHARIEKKIQGYILKDLRSRNGTYVNDVQVMEALLRPGDKIRMGESSFLFQDRKTNTLQKQELKSKNSKWGQQLETLPFFSKTELPVLILGPSGSGKEVLAKTIHANSDRAHKPFVSVNCSALSESLVESELFGHTKGSFTGAASDRKGAFECARGGTLFLDEIGDLPLSLQPKLLRALENKEIKPVGSDSTHVTDVRIIAATHQNLPNKILRGEFRADLFYRLHVIRLQVPSLSQRLEDFEDLLMKFCKEFRVSFHVETIRALSKYNWPGNIRELRNVVARASALFPGQKITKAHIEHLIDLLPMDAYKESVSSTKGVSAIKEIEKELIIQRLIANQGSQKRTAIDLNMPKSTLHDRIKTYNIDIKKLLVEGH